MVRPTVSQARSWRPEALHELADAWDAAAGQVQSAASGGSPDGQGSALQAAAEKWRAITDSATAAARVLVGAAVVARNGAERIGAARLAVVHAIESAEQTGFRVADDGTTTPAGADSELLGLMGGPSGTVHLLSCRSTVLTGEITAALDGLGTVDADTARKLLAAFRSGAPTPEVTRPTGVSTDRIVADWPTMAQDRIAEQVAAMTPEQRRQLVAEAPRQVGNTDGVPWELRIAANRINITDAILAERRTIDRPVEDKIRVVVDERYGARWDRISLERARQAIAADPVRRAAAVADHDRMANRRIAFYQGLLADVPDPVRSAAPPVPRQILAFDPERAELVEFTGDLSTASNVGVLVPGLNTTILDSGENTETVRRFVAAGGGDVAMITYLGGPFPTGPVWNAGTPQYALQMAPRLVAFSEDVNRTVDNVGAATGRSIAVTYLGHSYGGSILGTAEREGLTADRTVYVEAAGAGVGVFHPSDWHNRNPAVRRFSMTAPLDPIEIVQGLPLGPHGADPDNMPGVVRLPTGRRSDGSLMAGLDAHGDVLDEPSDAWHRLLEVITGRR